jgi:hypothetical protein
VLHGNPFSSIVQVDSGSPSTRCGTGGTEASRRGIGKLLLSRFCSLLEGKISPASRSSWSGSNLMIEEVAALLPEKEEISIRYRQLLSTSTIII